VEQFAVAKVVLVWCFFSFNLLHVATQHRNK